VSCRFAAHRTVQSQSTWFGSPLSQGGAFPKLQRVISNSAEQEEDSLLLRLALEMMIEGQETARCLEMMMGINDGVFPPGDLEESCQQRLEAERSPLVLP